MEYDLIKNKENQTDAEKVYIKLIDSLKNKFGDNFRLTTKLNEYYTKLSLWYTDDPTSELDINKPLVVMGKTNIGKTTPFKYLSIDRYFDLEHVDNELHQKCIEKLKQDKSSYWNGQSIIVLDNFGLKPTYNHYGEKINIIQEIISTIDWFSENNRYKTKIYTEDKYSYEYDAETGVNTRTLVSSEITSKSKNKLVIITGMPISALEEILDGSEHHKTRLRRVFNPNSLLIL